MIARLRKIVFAIPIRTWTCAPRPVRVKASVFNGNFLVAPYRVGFASPNAYRSIHTTVYQKAHATVLTSTAGPNIIAALNEEPTSRAINESRCALNGAQHRLSPMLSAMVELAKYAITLLEIDDCASFLVLLRCLRSVASLAASAFCWPNNRFKIDVESFVTRHAMPKFPADQRRRSFRFRVYSRILHTRNGVN